MTARHSGTSPSRFAARRRGSQLPFPWESCSAACRLLSVRPLVDTWAASAFGCCGHSCWDLVHVSLRDPDRFGVRTLAGNGRLGVSCASVSRSRCGVLLSDQMSMLKACGRRGRRCPARASGVAGVAFTGPRHACPHSSAAWPAICCFSLSPGHGPCLSS